MTKLFALGATGFIGGDAFYAIAKARPDLQYTCLVRSSEKGSQVVAEFPNVRLVYGDLDSSDLIEKESHDADIVCNWAHADHAAAATAIVKGLLSKSTPGYLIHTSGTGILLFTDMDNDTYGESSTKVYDDFDNLSEVTNLPDHAPHRNVDKIVLEAGIDHSDKLKTAIVCPPTIYGQGRGPGNKRSHQVPELARCTIEKGHGLQVGAGKTFWTYVNVLDLSDLYLKLVDAAIAGGKPATWGAEGYYFAEDGEFTWGEAAKWVVAAAKKQGLIEDDNIVSIDKDEASKLSPFGHGVWGANSRARAIRARKLLGWKPKAESLPDNVPKTVEIEGKKLGKPPGHAAKAAGTA